MAMFRYMLLCFVSKAFAAVLTAAPHLDNAALQLRQTTATTTTSSTTIVGWYSNRETTVDGKTTTIWAPIVATTAYYANNFFFTTNDYFNTCPFTLSYQTYSIDATSTYLSTIPASPTTSCTVYTECSGGILYGPGVSSYFCETLAQRCISYTLYESFGESEGVTSLGCASPLSSDATATKLYKTKPDETGLPPSTPTPTPGSGSPSPATSTPTSSTAAAGGGGGGSKNAGAIAGGVVGGLAVLALAGIAILWILKRGKKQPEPQAAYAHPQTPTPYYPPNQADKTLESHGMYNEQRMSEVPEYVPQIPQIPQNPHAGYGNGYGHEVDGYGRTSPQHTHSPEFRGELSGVRSPAL